MSRSRILVLQFELTDIDSYFSRFFTGSSLYSLGLKYPVHSSQPTIAQEHCGVWRSQQAIRFINYDFTYV
jgi:hypothetical protein